ncbi:unnamed protein product [Allacma fusca]|uniref:Transmembrane protein 186 n=1 Tax=Allacma fusca TaxID=39272 RepID=A0A8J2K8U9_9HEXA|nr:unnamed protein product [Allacma fusca]
MELLLKYSTVKMMPFKNLSWVHNRLQNLLRHRNLIGTGNYLRPIQTSSASWKKDEPKRVNQKPTDDWTTVYRFDRILFARAIQKFKVYQTGFSCFIIAPTTVGLYFHGILDNETAAGIFGGVGFTCGALYFLGNIFNRLVAIIYTSPSRPKEIKIARLTFWGNRMDTLHPIDDFIPLGDLNYKPTAVYFRLKLHSDYNEFMYLSCSSADTVIAVVVEKGGCLCPVHLIRVVELELYRKIRLE